MKKIKIVMLMLALMMIFGRAFAIAEPAAEVEAEVQVSIPAEPLTWDYLATVGGAAVFVLIVVQITKGMLDKIWKIPTAIYAYVIAVITMILATAFTVGLTPSGVLLTLFNGWIVSATASRTYDAVAHKT